MSFDEADSTTMEDETGAARGADERPAREPNPEAAQGDPARQRSATPGESDDDGQADRPRSKRPLIILAIIVAVLGIAGFIWWFAHRNEVTTDDAYTDGNTVTMIPKVSGYVIALYVDDNAHVKKGDLLVRIDPRDYETARLQARAQLALAQAQLRSAQNALRIARVQYPAQLLSAQAQRQAAAAASAQAEAGYKRQHEVDRRATTQENIDASTREQLSAGANVKSAQAQVSIAALVPEQIEQATVTVAERQAEVDQAEAELAQADLNIGYTEVRSPVDGYITLRSAQLGGYLTAGQSMFLIVTPAIWVTANFKESQIGRMRPGDRVDLQVDAYSALKLRGHVQSIQYGSGSRFSVFPAENATGNFVKIVQRIPVKIVIDDGLDPDRPLPLGLSVTPDVHIP